MLFFVFYCYFYLSCVVCWCSVFDRQVVINVSSVHLGFAAFYWARELVFTRNQLIAFTTSRELSHYLVFSRIMADRKVDVVLKSIVFFFLCVCSFIFTNRVSTYFAFENTTNISFDLIKTLSSICAYCKTLHVDAAIFIS